MTSVEQPERHREEGTRPASGGEITITACILARNEERRIEAALQCLQGWTDEILVIDNESEDGTTAVARRYTDRILTASKALNFDAIRNLAIGESAGGWIFYLDADERVPPGLGPKLRRLVQERGHEFEALLIPFKHYFCGRWMQHSGWWPGYTRPQLLKKGRFHYHDRLHAGVKVDGRMLHLPADVPDLAIDHYSYDDLHHYLEKLNHYTDGEAVNLLADRAVHSWQAQLAHLVHDWQLYYDRNRGDLDGMHGFVLAFLSGVYRFLARAKLWDLRRQRGEILAEDAVPGSLREILEFMAKAAQQDVTPWLAGTYPRVHRPGEPVPAVWLSPLADTEPAPAPRPNRRGPRITGCILARNEERQIEAALRSLQGWTDEILLIDNESTDATAELARRYADRVLSAPRQVQFDGARNLASEHATGEWIFFLDADERVPPRLGPVLRRLVEERGNEFEALCIPFRNHFYGKWMQCSVWWPGYKGPQLVKKGAFRYGERLHVGAVVTGRTYRLPADDAELAILHYAYDDIGHYLRKLNHYTEGEAENLLEAGHSHSWQAQLAHFVYDWQEHYDHGHAHADGMHGFVQAFLCALYRFVSRAKLWDRRRKCEGANGHGGEEAVPANLREMLEFMAHVMQHGAEQWLCQPHKVPTAPSNPPVLLDGSSSARPVPLLWRGPVYDASGFADEARSFLLGLIAAGEPLAIAAEAWSGDDAALPAEVRDELLDCAAPPETPAAICVHHTVLSRLEPAPNAAFNVGRSMFETDGLPKGAAERLNKMDRIWVPSEFNRETFVRNGVEPEKLAVVPEAIDALPFGLPDIEPWAVPGREQFRFLSLFDWTLHKGWDVLVEAFAAEFGRGEAVASASADAADAERNGVGLILKVWSSLGYSLEMIREQIDAHLRAKLGRSLAEFPNIHVWQETIPTAEMPRLYRAVDAFVLPTRGEGWCRPLMEAMAAGLPTIATAWSGLTAFHHAGVGYPLPYRLLSVSAAGACEIPDYAGHRWAEPDSVALRRLMRWIVRDPEAARELGRVAQEEIRERYSRSAVTALMQEELAFCREKTQHDEAQQRSTSPPGVLASDRSLPARPNPNPLPLDPVEPVDFLQALGHPLRVQWEGDQFIRSSLALVNRELCLGLLSGGDVSVALKDAPGPFHTLSPSEDTRLATLAPRRNVEPAEPPDVTVRHHWPPNWEPLAGESVVGGGKLVVMQPWELSHLPTKNWVEGAIRHADEVWAYSRFVRDVYVRSGVPAEKVRIVPLGVRTEVFRPEGERYALPTQKSLRFLFVGGTLERKGADLLLAAYRRAFGAADDVCLVVKDMGTQSFYRGQNLAAEFQNAAADTHGPEVIYLDEDLSDEALASLYRSCHCVVSPYRNEGFCLPPLEGMACGLPAIVTAGGPTEDYLDDTIALRVPSHRRVLTGLYQGPDACDWDPWSFEPDFAALVDALRWVRDHPEGARERGEAARAHVLKGWTWERSVRIARERLYRLVGQTKTGVQVFGCSGVPVGTAARLWREPAERDEAESERAGEGETGGASESRSQSISRPPFSSSISASSSAVPGRPELSLCMIVRDEAARIESCLKSIAPFVDEMVVVDTGSADETREIALACGARVFECPWVDSFAVARNASLEAARGEWLFWMDADDVISPECGAQLRDLIRQHPRRDAAYQVQVRIPPGPGEFSPSVVDHVKLFPNRPDVRFEHRIHEQILPALRRAGVEVRFSNLHVTHAHYDRSEEGQVKKRRRDFRLLELDLADRPDHPFVLFNLGMTYLYATKEYEVAAHYLRRSLERSDWRDSIVRKAYAMLATARLCQGECEAALAANEEGRRYYPDDAELLFQAGQIYRQVGRLTEAHTALERLLAGQDGQHFRSVDVGLRTYRGQHERALLLRQMGDVSRSERELREIVRDHPEYLPAQHDLAETRRLLGRDPKSPAPLSGIQPRSATARPIRVSSGEDKTGCADARRSERTGVNQTADGPMGTVSRGMRADASGIAELIRLFPWPATKPQGVPEPTGWFDEANQAALAPFISVKTRVIVELGSWHGMSTRWLCDQAPNARVIAVDHWLGGSDHWELPECVPLLPTLYETFVAASWDYREQIVPVRTDSVAGMRLIHRLGILPDLIYVDASHETEDVIRDLETALDLFPTARIVGDDWPRESVRSAVESVAQRRARAVRDNGRSWWLL